MTSMVSERLLDISLPLWDELPADELTLEGLVDYVQTRVGVFLSGSGSITKHMINNYVKRNIFPRPVNRKYNREHISTAIVYSLLKQVLEVGEIDRAITMYESLFSYKDAYNEFVKSFEYMKKAIVNPLVNIKDTVVLKEVRWNRTRMLMMGAVASLIFLLITRDIINSGNSYMIGTI